MSEDQPSTTTVDGTHITDPPDPDLVEIEQRDPPVPAVPVCVEGPATVHRLPALKTAVIGADLTTTMVKVLDADPKRSGFVVCCDEAWRYARQPTGIGVLFPADLPIRFEHADKVYARAATGTATLSIVVELWAGA